LIRESKRRIVSTRRKEEERGADRAINLQKQKQPTNPEKRRSHRGRERREGKGSRHESIQEMGQQQREGKRKTRCIKKWSPLMITACWDQRREGSTQKGKGRRGEEYLSGFISHDWGGKKLRGCSFGKKLREWHIFLERGGPLKRKGEEVTELPGLSVVSNRNKSVYQTKHRISANKRPCWD